MSRYDYEISRARSAFPAGLVQPEGCLRFGADALLLAAFAARRLAQVQGDAPVHAAEAGTGCGAVLFALALSDSRVCGAGIDCEPELVEAARLNALKLGLADRLKFVCVDLETDCTAGLPKSSFDLVLANPPWLLPEAGRQPGNRLRQKAVCATTATLPAFLACLAGLLKRRGFGSLLLPAALLCEFCVALAVFALGLREILPLASCAGASAQRLLFLVQKDAASCPQLLAPLVLHENGKWSAAALAFCPWLGHRNPQI